VKDKTTALQHELNEMRAQINTLERNLEEKPDYGLGKGAPAITQWELDQTLLRQLKERVASIERTLSQTGGDTYGICEQCGKPIHPDRLAVLPNTRICIGCARAGESRRVDQ
jgi:DnaK suppressor protein